MINKIEVEIRTVQESMVTISLPLAFDGVSL
jgi:hypothetical protein